MRRLLPVGLRIVGIAVVGSGIGIDLITGEPFGLVVITGGSCLIAISGVVWVDL